MKRLAATLLLLAAPVLAHGGAHEVEPGPAGWTLSPSVTGPLLLTAGLYVVGAARLWRRSELGRAQLRRDGLVFAAGWFVLAASVVSPLHEAGERSFTMHMIEHELIMLVAALLLVAARPAAAMLWALPQSLRRTFAGGTQNPLWRFLTDPIVATVLQAIAMWAWHAPALFDRALGHEGWHIAQHLSFLITALLFWWAMLHGRAGYGVSALCLFATSLVGGLLGALMAFSRSPWYAGYAAMGMTPYGLTPAEDQHLAGLLMWIPGGLFHAGAALYFVWRWLKVSERNAVPAR
jgi:putative membrane protein